MKEYMKKKQDSHTYMEKVKNHIGIIIWLPGFILLYYIWSTQNEPMFIGIGLFTTVLPFGFSVLSWIVGGIIYFRKNRIKNTNKWHILSYICCVLALWMFLVDIDCKIRNNDISSIRDLSMYYSCTSLFVFLMTTWINVKAYVKRKESTQSEK